MHFFSCNVSCLSDVKTALEATTNGSGDRNAEKRKNVEQIQPLEPIENKSAMSSDVGGDEDSSDSDKSDASDSILSSPIQPPLLHNINHLANTKTHENIPEKEADEFQVDSPVVGCSQSSYIELDDLISTADPKLSLKKKRYRADDIHSGSQSVRNISTAKGDEETLRKRQRMRPDKENGYVEMRIGGDVRRAGDDGSDFASEDNNIISLTSSSDVVNGAESQMRPISRDNNADDAGGNVRLMSSSNNININNNLAHQPSGAPHFEEEATAADKSCILHQMGSSSEDTIFHHRGQI